MKHYTVVSSPEVENDLAAIWTAATDRAQVSTAANNADELLAANPKESSTEICEGLRRLDIPPLRFYFTIREDDRLVEVSNVVRMVE